MTTAQHPLPFPGLAGTASRCEDPDAVKYVLALPRWDTMWEIKTGRGGWPVVDPKTRKVRRRRKVWDALTGNARPGHWSQRATATRDVIDTVSALATKAGMRPCRRLTVRLVWAPGDRRRADRGNLMGLQKACIDALARGRNDLPGLRLVPDDTDRWVEELIPRIDRPPTPAGLWLEVWAHGETSGSSVGAGAQHVPQRPRICG